MSEETRKSRFNMHRAHAIACLKVLQEEIQNKKWEEGMDWGHVGDMASTEMRIQSLFEMELSRES